MKLIPLLAFAFLLPFFADAQQNYNFQFDETESVEKNYVEVPVLLSSPPTQGTFFSAQLNLPPWPMNPLEELNLDIYSFSGGFIYDDRKVDYVALQEEQKAQREFSRLLNEMEDGPTPPGEGDAEEGPTPNPPLAFDYTNGLWLSIYSYDSNWMTLTLHGTVEGGYYEILTKTNLSETNWTVDHGFIGQDNSTLANSIWLPGRTNFFFWARYTSLDSDGDGLPDWWEVEHGLNPNLADTGNTGTPDGYKDADGDGWSNIEEYQNGTSPSAFNTPPAPRGLTVVPNSSETIANLSWNPSGGSVTGYTVERTYINNTSSFSVAPNSSTMTDYQPPAHNILYEMPPRYRIRANYSAGSSAWSGYVSLHPPGSATSFWIARGTGGFSYLIATDRRDDVSALRVTRFNSYSLATNVFTLSRANFTNNVAQISQEQVSTNISDSYWVQTIAGNGTVGQFLYAGSTYKQSIRFYDGREQLKQNLSFLLRAANTEEAFYFELISTGQMDYRYHSNPATYAYAGIYNGSALAEFRPFLENNNYRNFVFDLNHLNDNGRLTNGGFSSGYLGNYFTLTNAGATYRFQAPTNVITIPGVLSSAESAGIYFPFSPDRIGIDYDRFFGPSPTNIFGLAYSFIHQEWYGAGTDIYPNHYITNLNNLYPVVLPPVLRTVGYYFARPSINPIPGTTDFSITNSTPILIISGNNPFLFLDEFGPYYDSFRVAGYAKQAIDNGDTNKFGYLGLYFDKAYKVNLDGTISTNQNGLLSEYGEYFPFEPGRVLLTTKPPSAGETNTGSCLVHVIKLEVDANHDGTIDRTITGSDNTSYKKPFTFWVNNDDDFIGIGKDIDYGGDYLDGKITSERDLEDFARLWISGVPSLPAAEGYSVSLGWSDYSDNVKIKIYPATESDGGIGYLTNSTIAAQQMILLNGQISPGQSMGEVSLGSPLTFPASYFNGTRKHFLFEGSAPGKGDLVLTIYKNGEVIAGTLISIQIKDIKEIYEQAHVENVYDTTPSTATATFKSDRILGNDSAEEKQLIVFVHGWRMGQWDYESFSQTMFKRLYWQGYQGRFAAVRWPALSQGDFKFFSDTQSLFTYNQSEFRAFQSGTAMASYLNWQHERLPDYSINVAAHSMGNIVMMEALKQHAASNVMAIDNYVLMQAAVPAHCYDTSFASFNVFTTKEVTSPTPDTYRGYSTNIAAAVNNSIVNFFNTNDYALATATFAGVNVSWQGNETIYKPDTRGYYSFDGTNVMQFSLVITDSREKMAFAARPRSKAAGASSGVTGVIQSGGIDLTAAFNFRGNQDEHSAQFNWNIQRVGSFYKTLGQKLRVIPED